MRRPIILLSITAFLQTLFILVFPNMFPIAISLMILLLTFFVVLFIGKRKYILIIPTALILVFASLNPYFAYLKNEKKAQDFALSLSGSKDVEYSATVTECNVYSSYSQIFANLTKVGQNELDKSYRIRITSFNKTPLEKGDKIVFTGTPRNLLQIDKNENFDTRTYLKSKKVFIDFQNAVIVSSAMGEDTSAFEKARNYVKRTIYTYIRGNKELDTADICYAMFSGDKDLLSPQVKTTFRISGLTHLLCVSGLHLAILAGFVYKLLSWLSVHKNIKCLVIVGACVVYTLFTGASLSTIRACMMCSVGFAGHILGRKTDAFRSLFASLLIIVLVSPYSVFDISALLSFSATLGIICFSELCPHYNGKSNTRKILHALLDMLFVNLGAMMFSLVLCAYFFSEVSLFSAISTFAVSYITELLLVLIPILIMVSPVANISVFCPIVSFIGSVCDFLCSLILKIAEFISGFRYAAITPVLSEVWICLFAVSVILIAIFASFGKDKPKRICIYFIVILNVILTFMALYSAIIDDSTYKVTYYRKNENDRQLSIKLATEGYLLVNADNTLCTNSNYLPFDKKNGKNYLLVIPDSQVNPEVLAQNIYYFDRRYGLQKVYLPNNQSGMELAKSLADNGITCYYMPNEAIVGDICITLRDKDGYYISIDDKEVKTGILFSKKYNSKLFEDDCNICAYFTRYTYNQFSASTDAMPPCDIFITRLGKNEELSGCINTNGEKTITVKG